MAAEPVNAETIRRGLQALRFDIPWTHYFNLCGVETITRKQDEKFYGKSVAVRKLGQLALCYYQHFCEGLPLHKARVLDVGSAEGALAVDFAQAGAAEVIGIEGRRLYIDRANFVTHALGLNNIRFELGDVRKIDAARSGTFDFIIASGILHHLGQDDFLPFLSSMAALTRGSLFLYTHVSTKESIKSFRLHGPVKAAGLFEGWLLQEHDQNASQEQREQQVRASLDNTFSFLATEQALIEALRHVGFKFVACIQEPHIFGNPVSRAFRPIIIAKK